MNIDTIRSKWMTWQHHNGHNDHESWKPVTAQTSSSLTHPYEPFYSKKIGFILLAGGSGSRLGTDTPKALVPLLGSGKTLLEIFLMRQLNFYKQYSLWPKCAIMTSSDTDTQTREYLTKNNFFQIPKEHVSIFCQSSLPLLNEEGQPFQENGVLVQGPDGNGGVFSAFSTSGLLRLWKEQGIEAVSILCIDNPLMDPFLPSLFAPVLDKKKEASIAAITRKSEQEKVGVLLQEKNTLRVIEYSELPSAIKSDKKDDGTLRYPWANISVCVVAVQAIEKLSKYTLPLHFAMKTRKGKKVYKPEYFIFDVFPAFHSFAIIPLDRARFFSPIKNATGEDSLETGSQAFLRMLSEQENHKLMPNFSISS